MKKFLSLIMAIAMVAMMSVASFAATVTDIQGLTDAVAAGGDVVLGADIEISTSLRVENNVNLDLNGWTLTGPHNYVGGQNLYAFIVDVGGTLTLDDNSDAQTGEIDCQYSGIETKGGTFIMNGGKITAGDMLYAAAIVNYGGSVGDNGYMARIKSGKDITIEGIGADACINGWGLHFMAESSNPTLGKSFEVRNIAFRNVPEDCIGMEGVQTGSSLTAPVERCWIHHCSFYAPKISNPAESDKSGGDGACDFKRGLYFTNSYCYYEGYHKTNLVGASDSNLQYHITYHHNYWKNCESRGPLLRQANVHMYNNVFDGQTSYCMNPRANGYIFSEYNVFVSSKNPMTIKSGAIKSYKDTFTNCKGDQDGTIVSSKSQKVSSNNKYASFELDSSLSYIPANDYVLHTSDVASVVADLAGAL